MTSLMSLGRMIPLLVRTLRRPGMMVFNMMRLLSASGAVLRAGAVDVVLDDLHLGGAVDGLLHDGLGGADGDVGEAAGELGAGPALAAAISSAAAARWAADLGLGGA